ncbi:glutathione S-transferase family protein [Photobacterium sp. WH77]|uniref:Glutathione S-transferase family protein n=1 Tax=Photobacterium arenosum TaxID=2774143 RepID=A0ABR9BK04_9GAMM|nr:MULTISPECIES: glutathione S-transferase family protein [Photobacterium]MBD8511957.1 glutathione S-transferase family protein [Photobacterium arenosum]MCG2836236.1 glutathione S-transferase family protein [Photobacterium sp. WH77]MCG2843627.1 glutathione S-transferase family protein [Photobacterium sp. WH80]MDO6581054.1 glutathione S-transferase family protein [Photobacterium sp. 2_MG-2023]
MSDKALGNELVFFHSPHTRSSSVLILLNELNVPFKLNVLNMLVEENRQPAYLAINPLGKVPALLDDGALITDQVAIYLYLADLFSSGGLAPGLSDPLRGPYLRWMLYYSACFEPAVCDKAMGWVPNEQKVSPYGDYDTVLGILIEQLRAGPYLLGERFTAADLLWATALKYCTAFGSVEPDPVITQYLARVTARPCFTYAKDLDTKLAADHEAGRLKILEAGEFARR